MGWTYFAKPNDVKRWFEQELTWENAEVTQCVLASAVSLTEGYAAVERIDRATGQRTVFAAVSLFKHIRTSDPYNFGYKDFSEASGHGLINCPARILDLLTPTGDRTANEWRQACRERLARRNSLKGIAVGDVVVFDEPLHFERYGSLRLFTYAGKGVVSPGDTFNALARNGRPIGYVKIRNWRNRRLARYGAAELPRILAQVTREDDREAKWLAILAQAEDLPTGAFEAWVRAEARTIREGGEFTMRRSLVAAGMSAETAATIAAENADLLTPAGSLDRIEGLLRTYWTTTALARSLRNSSWERPGVARLLARTPGLGAPDTAAMADVLDADLKWLTAQAGELLRQHDIDADDPEFIGAWRYVGDNRAALVPVRTPEGRALYLLMAVHEDSDRISISAFSSRNTSEMNVIDAIDLRPSVGRPDHLRPDGDLDELRQAVTDLAGLLEDLDAAAKSWDQDDAGRVAP